MYSKGDMVSGESGGITREGRYINPKEGTKGAARDSVHVTGRQTAKGSSGEGKHRSKLEAVTVKEAWDKLAPW